MLLTLFTWNPIFRSRICSPGMGLGRRAFQAVPHGPLPSSWSLEEGHHDSVTVGTDSCQSCLTP